MKFLKRLYACLKHYEMPVVLVYGDRRRLTGAWVVKGADVLFETVNHLDGEVYYEFTSYLRIEEINLCH